MARKGFLKMQFLGGADLAQSLMDLAVSSAIKRAMKVGVIATLTPVAIDAAAKAPRGKDHELAENIIVSTELSRRQKRTGYKYGVAGDTTVTAYVGPTAGMAGRGVLAEFGTTERHQKTGKSTGAEPMRPWMRPAWEQNKGNMLPNLGHLMGIAIEAEATRIARRQAKLLKSKK